jgi:hypothetical protein
MLLDGLVIGIALLISLWMFVLYLAILFVIAEKKLLFERKTIILMTSAGLAFGMLSYVLVITPLNSIEACFMDNRGLFHVLLVGPVQEEIAKFACFVLAYIFITRRSQLSDKELSEVKRREGLIMLGIYVGLALALLENIIDYGYLTLETAFLRTILSWPAHMITISISSYGFNIYRITRKVVMVSVLLFCAISVHVAINSLIILLQLIF